MSSEEEIPEEETPVETPAEDTQEEVDTSDDSSTSNDDSSEETPVPIPAEFQEFFNKLVHHEAEYQLFTAPTGEIIKVTAEVINGTATLNPQILETENDE